MVHPSIIAVRPAPPGAGRAIAFVDVQLNGLRLFNLKLVDGPSGRRIHAPSAYGSSVVTFTPDLAATLVRLSSTALGDIRRDSIDSNAA